jgi:hypothetical protein
VRGYSIGACADHGSQAQHAEPGKEDAIVVGPSPIAQLELNADGSYDLRTNLSMRETVKRMRAALDDVMSKPLSHDERESFETR